MLGAAQLAVAILVLVGIVVAHVIGQIAANGPTEIAVLLAFMALGFSTVMAGGGLSNPTSNVRVRWIFGVAAAVCQIPLFPVGSATGIYALHFLLSRQTRTFLRGRGAIVPDSVPVRARENFGARARIREGIGAMLTVQHWFNCGTIRSISIGLAWTGMFFISACSMWVNVYSAVNPPVTSVMLIRHVEGVRVRNAWVPESKVASNWIQSVVAREDSTFFEHDGFNWYRIRIARLHVQAGERAPASSTVSQQVAKNCFLWPGRSILRKGLEAYFTTLMEMSWSKDRIMYVYLNIAEMANGVFGIEAASDAYFEKPSNRLTLGETNLVTMGMPFARQIDPDQPAREVRKELRKIAREKQHAKSPAPLSGADG